MNKIKYILLPIIFLALLAAAWFLGYKSSFVKQYKKEDVSVMMDRIQKVCKLVAVEGYVSEIYNYKDYYYYDIQLLRKKALIRVKAKVSVGYDFEDIQITTDETTHLITIRDLPPPEILSIEHDLEYYDVDEGTFNNFSEEELTELNKNAKAFVLEKAKESDLFAEAESQKQSFIDALTMIVSASGWNLELGKESLKN